jgi:hypothetical protein
MEFDQALALTSAAPPGLLARLPAPIHLAALTMAAFPVALAMSLLWWVFYPAWLLTRRTRRPAERRRPARGR